MAQIMGICTEKGWHCCGNQRKIEFLLIQFLLFVASTVKITASDSKRADELNVSQL